MLEAAENNAADSLYDYIADNALSSTDYPALNLWSECHPNFIVRIYHNSTLIYDSLYDTHTTRKQFIDNISEYSSHAFYELQFSDICAYASIYYNPPTTIYKIIYFILFLLFAMLYILCMTFFIQKKVDYIVKLATIQKEFSKGIFSTPIPINGNDELTRLAKEMEKSCTYVKTESNIAKSQNYFDLITGLSHDLRTPLAVMIGYMEISLKSNDLQFIKSNLQHALNRANHLRDLTDKLFEYFLLAFGKEKLSFEKINANELIFQMVEETLCDLESDGVKVKRTTQDISCTLNIDTEAIHRVFTNIFSNIKKYADLSQTVYVNYHLENKKLVVSFQNAKNTNSSPEYSSQIGLKNCKEILEKHYGSFEITETSDFFSLTLCLPIVTNEK